MEERHHAVAVHPAVYDRRTHVLISYMQTDEADGTQALDPQREALLAAEVDPIRLYEDRA
jgi:hypothetical protein